MASSKIHSRGASMSGRKNTLPIYGDFSKTRENYRKQTTAYPGQVLLISPAPPAAKRGTHKVVAVSAPLAKVIQARQADRHCEKSPDERGLRVGSPVGGPLAVVPTSSEALADLTGNELAGQDQLVGVVADFYIINLASHLMRHDLVQSPEDAGHGANSLFQIAEAESADMDFGAVSVLVMMRLLLSHLRRWRCPSAGPDPPSSSREASHHSIGRCHRSAAPDSGLC